MIASSRLEGDQLIATRRLDAPPDLVWEAFTTPAHLAAFWGGDHATVAPESVTVDLRVGGRFDIEAMGCSGGDGGRLSFTYEAIDEPRRLVLVEPQSGLRTEIRLEPGDDGSATTVTIHQRRLPPELRTDEARAGLDGLLAALAAELAGTSRATVAR